MDGVDDVFANSKAVEEKEEPAALDGMGQDAHVEAAEDESVDAGAGEESVEDNHDEIGGLKNTERRGPMEDKELKKLQALAMKEKIKAGGKVTYQQLANILFISRGTLMKIINGTMSNNCYVTYDIILNRIKTNGESLKTEKRRFNTVGGKPERHSKVQRELLQKWVRKCDHRMEWSSPPDGLLEGLRGGRRLRWQE